MRRPLFWVALSFVLITAVRLKTGALDVKQPGVVRVGSLETSKNLIVAGQVYKKDNQTIYLQDISVHLDSQAGISRQNSQYGVNGQNIQANASGQNIQTVASGQNIQADVSRQNISCKDNMICKLTESDNILLGSYVTLEGSFAPFSPATNP